jgi:hypothetical protein
VRESLSVETFATSSRLLLDTAWWLDLRIALQIEHMDLCLPRSVVLKHQMVAGTASARLGPLHGTMKAVKDIVGFVQR